MSALRHRIELFLFRRRSRLGVSPSKRGIQHSWLGCGMIIQIPGTSNLESIARFPLELRQMESDEEMQLDFREVQFTTPAWLAVVGGALRQLKLDRPHTKRRALNYRHLTYAGHMGFFEYFGLQFGHPPDHAPGSDTYVPLSTRRTNDIRHQAGLMGLRVGEIVHSEA